MKDSGYLVKHLLRCVLLRLQEESPRRLDSVTLSQVADLLPDEREHLTPLLGMTLAAVEAESGSNPLLLGCTSCLLNTLPPAQLQKALRASNVDLMRLIRRHEHEEVRPTEGTYADGFFGCPADLLASL